MVIIITGASSGIGYETANFLAKQGHSVHGLSRRGTSSGHFMGYKCDITNRKEFLKVASEIMEKEGRIDVLINNAGMGISGAVEHTKDEDIERLFEINQIATFNACRDIIPFFRRSSGGKIINIGSVAGVIPIPFQSYYSASKAALQIFSNALRLELKPFNIKVCTVLPGDTKTDFTKSRVKNETIEDEIYGKRIAKSVAKMEKDEQNGMPAIAVSKVISKMVKKKNPPPYKTVGVTYKLIIFLSKIMPARFMLWVVKLLYG